ncbi:GGDEF domain-containing protein [Thermodesulfovibrio sp. 3462-1]|uniref:diguanylate cyclase n=1 Tax=Thermodesulfovibrio obliviosus TaxID=3118332 RepID=A0AAU8H591_9BACT
MMLCICSNRKKLLKKLSDFLNKEFKDLSISPIDNETVERIYKIEPDIIIIDFCGKACWKLLEKITRAPSIREIPLILIFKRKEGKLIEKLCNFEIFDYVIEPLLKCEILMKINKAEEIVGLKKEFKSLLTRDPLTGAYQRGFLIERMNEEIHWCNLYKEPLTLAMFDIDFFKKINDTYGHQTGDKVLMELIHLAHQSMPEMALIGRYGGDEFCVVLPSTDEMTAKDILEAFRQTVEKNDFYTFKGEKIKVTISIGFTTYYAEQRCSIDEIIQKADIALYKAKQQGRNRVIFQDFDVE